MVSSPDSEAGALNLLFPRTNNYTESNNMTPVFLDFETFWDVRHSLTCMPPTEYVMHPETEIQSLAMKVGRTGETEVVFGEDDIRALLKTVDWSDAMAIGHNMSGFDSMILAWRLGVNPKMYGCTAAMARQGYSKTATNVGGRQLTGVSLKKLSAEFGVGKKLDLEATNTKGKKLADFSFSELAAMKEYNKVDTDLCAELFYALLPEVPKKELVLIDMTTRMLVEPGFELDTTMVEKALVAVREEKKQSLLNLAKLLDYDEYIASAEEEGVPLEERVRSALASAARFGALLKQLNVEVPTKISKQTGQVAPALAKTDQGFIDLVEHEDPLVAAAAQARLDVKSTILETRLEAFLRASSACKGKVPVPLKYCGADTTGRWSGEQYNMQNLPRINPKSPKPSDALRNALRAPKGHMVVVADLSGIELRVNHYLWKVQSSMDLYSEDAEADLYKAFAAARYNITPEEVTKDQRQLAKVAQLGLGFGSGHVTFRKVAKLMGGLNLDEQESKAIVDDWRRTYKDIVAGWKAFHASLVNIKDGTEKAIDPWGLCVTEKEAVRLPSGRKICYPNLRQKRDENGMMEWWYGNGRTTARIYAGKGDENMVQALARDVIADNALKFYKQTKLSPAMMVHDELVYIVPEADAQSALDALQAIMRAGVSWWPELITWSEGDIAPCYGAAK